MSSKIVGGDSIEATEFPGASGALNYYGWLMVWNNFSIYWE